VIDFIDYNIGPSYQCFVYTRGGILWSVYSCVFKESKLKIHIQHVIPENTVLQIKIQNSLFPSIIKMYDQTKDKHDFGGFIQIYNILQTQIENDQLISFPEILEANKLNIILKKYFNSMGADS
jgi:hypothetical protein